MNVSVLASIPTPTCSSSSPPTNPKVQTIVKVLESWTLNRTSKRGRATRDQDKEQVEGVTEQAQEGGCEGNKEIASSVDHTDDHELSQILIILGKITD